MKYFSIVFILTFIYLTFCNEIDNKLSKKLIDILKQYNHHNNNIQNHNFNNLKNYNKLKLWVTFNSKDNNFNLNEHDISNHHHIESITGLKKESIERRIKRSINKDSIIDDTDLPVSTNFIKQVLKCGNNNYKIKLHQQSKWLNSISITIKIKNNNSNNKYDYNNIISCISSKHFVESIDLVSKFKIPSLNSNINNNININQNNNHINNDNEYYNKLINNKKLLEINENQNDNSNNQDNEKYFDEKFYGNSYAQIKQSNIDKLHKLGLDGTGIRILITDTGFYKKHDVFKTLDIIGELNVLGSNSETEDYFNDASQSVDDSQNDHGTATLSVLAGFKKGVLVGAAYRASILLAKTENNTIEDQIEEDYWATAVEWGEKNGAHIISCSLGYEDWYNTASDFNGKVSKMTKVANLAAKKGVVVVSGIGNSGENGMGAPSDSFYSISVGSVNSDGERSIFSSVGPSSDSRYKPEVMAMGEDVFVAGIRNSSNYILYNGTSFSCPLVAGSVALLLQGHPDWSPFQVYEAITKTASNSLNPDIYNGFGILDIYAAYNYKPIEGNCSKNGCLNGGICCKNECICADDHYGYLCQFKKVECGNRCISLNGTCQINSFGSRKSYLCIDKEDSSKLYSTFDINKESINCNNHYSKNNTQDQNNSNNNNNNFDNLPYQLSNKLYSNFYILNLIVLIIIYLIQ